MGKCRSRALGLRDKEAWYLFLSTFCVKSQEAHDPIYEGRGLRNVDFVQNLVPAAAHLFLPIAALRRVLGRRVGLVDGHDAHLKAGLGLQGPLHGRLVHTAVGRRP